MTERKAMTTLEAMKYLQVSKPTILKMVHQGKIRANKIGREYRFLQEELDRFILGESIEPKAAAR